MSAQRARPTTLISVADYEAMSQAGAEFVAAEIGGVPDALVCLATGNSPARAYELLAAWGRGRAAACGGVRWLKLDEWGGLPPDHPASCERYLREKLLDPLQVPPARFHGWQSQPPDPERECRRIAGLLADQGPIDVCVLGLGLNGHLGFNEPGTALHAGPHLAVLSETSLSHPMLGGDRCGIRFGLTLGLADILHSRKVLLLVSGALKSEAMRRLSTREVTPEFPASLLWLHPALTIIADHAALSGCDGDGLRRFASD